MEEPQGGRSYLGSGRGHKVQESTFVFCSGYSCRRYVFLIASMISNLVKGRLIFFPLYFLSYLKIGMLGYVTV